MAQLRNIWDTPQPVNMSITPAGPNVVITILADCLATATKQSSSIELVDAVPAQFRPAVPRSSIGPIGLVKAGAPPTNGGLLVLPTGNLVFYPYSGDFTPDTAPAVSGLPAQVMAYPL